MILRRITLERYGCFGAGEFEFRRGLNLVCGNNETGKSLLLAVLPAVMLGTEHGARLRSWGDSLSCKAALLFVDGDRSVRLTRELENNLVRLEEGSVDGPWRECFSGRVPPHGSSAEHDRYYDHLQRLFGTPGEALLRVLLDAGQGASLLDGDGNLAGGLVAAVTEDAVSGPPPAAAAAAAPAARQAEIAALEADLRADREEYQKGEEYLAWIRKRWAEQAGRPAGTGKKASTDHTRAALEQQRNQLAAELQKHGVPARLPADLPGLFATAAELRQDLAVLQQELAPLQRARQGVVMPGSLWPLLATLAAVAAPGGAFLLGSTWLVMLAGAGGGLLLLAWGLYLVRLKRARAVRAGLDRDIQAVEIKREAALARQAELAERFEALGLPSAPVDMVKLQQLCQRHQPLIDAYRELCTQLGNEAPQMAGDDRHLRPEELPDAERRLALLRDSLQRREQRLRVLQGGQNGGVQNVAAAAAAMPTVKTLMPVIGQLLERLTCGRYREVRLVDGRLRLEAAPGQWVPPAACSRGTVDALLLALRMALAQASGVRLPLTVDDLPAALDSQRRQATLRTLERFASDHQVLLASYDEELAKRAVRERWPVVNLNLSQASQAVARKEEVDAGQLHLL
jgi:hypothetical protein